MVKLSGLISGLGGFLVLVGARLPWLIGSDPRSGGADSQGLAEGSILVACALVCMLCAFGLFLGGSRTPLGIGILVAASVAGVVGAIDFAADGVLVDSGANVFGPGIYVAAIGVVLCEIAAVGAFLVPNEVARTPHESPGAAGTR